ncbi:hypothetical protein ZWY2020_042881 [Hordeum vulgare]|nr:hypothetical protein ZWY2020_042881 [Hordeum vulgare]
MPHPPSQQRNLAVLGRRLALLSALLDSLLLDAVNICFCKLYIVLFHADLLVSYVASAVLNVIPTTSIRLSHDAVGWTKLFRGGCACTWWACVAKFATPYLATSEE